ncbi:hypothetical protein GCM10022242_10620 [Nocardioides panacisoli]|uniref:Secreted protein n=1 Tax=Nocardioides panacisoli TaxID=627624 RepID=A0ABP7I5H9_9ACTN
MRSAGPRDAGLAPAAVCLAVLFAGTGAAAYADSESHADRAHDVVEVSPSGTAARPGDRRRDVVLVRTVHAQHVVLLIAGLRRLGASGFELLWRVRTDAGTWRVQYNADIPSTPFVVVYPPGDDEPSDCLAGAHRDAAHRRVAVSVPRSCLGGPHWVRTGLLVRHWVQFDTDVRLDDARRTGLHGPARLGPRVQKG